VAGKHSCSLSPESVPHVAVEVVVAGEKQATRLAERYAGDPADYVVVAVYTQLLVRAYVEHSARSVV